jgi:membrane-bound lytic murein transglycosylase MltF
MPPGQTRYDLAEIESNSLLNIINERYYGYVDMFDFYNNHIYLKRTKSRLPRYETAFREVAEQYPNIVLLSRSLMSLGNLDRR